MLPVVLASQTKIGLAGAGEGFARRNALLAEAGVEPALVPADAADLGGLRLLFIAGLLPAEAGKLAGRARAVGVLVNVEDVPELCDFHVPANVRRGDLLISVSTGGRAPGLARLIREWIETRFSPDWPYRIDHLAHRRRQWRSEGQAPAEVSQNTRQFVEERRWL